MKRSTCFAAVLVFAALGFAVTDASAAPNVNSAVLHLRIWNDDPGSVVTWGNTYSRPPDAGGIWIQDSSLDGGGVGGWANRHMWRFSENTITNAIFSNYDGFEISTDLVLTGPAASEAALEVGPWWWPDVGGGLTVITNEGEPNTWSEIAAFGGRMPFYNFTWNHGVTYTKGDTIGLSMVYVPPGTVRGFVKYSVTQGGDVYTSGWLGFDMANPAEDPPHGLWGILNDAEVGGIFMPKINVNDPNNWSHGDFGNITYAPLAELTSLDLDIKPGSCPNSFNRGSHGVLPVALLGRPDFDVTTVDLASISLSRADGIGGSVAPHEGPPGPHSVFADVGTPFYGGWCDCDELEGDGITDLSMKFTTDDVVAALLLDELVPGALVELVLTGELDDGHEFIAGDCVRLVPPGTPPGLLAIASNSPGAWIDVGPLDQQLDGGGFADFERTFPRGWEVTLNAEATLDGGLAFSHWEINGVREPSTSETLSIVVSRGRTTIEAIYISGIPAPPTPTPSPTPEPAPVSEIR